MARISVSNDGVKDAADSEAHGNSLDSQRGQDMLALQDLDPALDRKMRLVNDVRAPGSLQSSSLFANRGISFSQAIDQLGWTPYHTKLFFLNGFG